MINMNRTILDFWNSHPDVEKVKWIQARKEDDCVAELSQSDDNEEAKGDEDANDTEGDDSQEESDESEEETVITSNFNKFSLLTNMD